MIQNIKVDIIYFKSATDFEFEFNLGGCCHMRLLNDKASDNKGFVNSLARAVSRSQIIISVGPLFGQDGLISVAAAAISHRLQTVDNKAYGINSDDRIEIIEGAVPLVTREGYFGGCIIESGNQSIIVLTENRTIRKSIMKTLVHPYIEDMCIMQSAERVGSSVIGDIKPSAVQPEGITADEERQSDGDRTVEPETEKVTEEFISEVREDTEEAEEWEKGTEDGSDVDPDGEHNIEFDFSDSDIEDGSEPKNEDFLPEKDFVGDNSRGSGINATILIVAAILLLVVLGLCYFLVFLPMINGMSTAEYFKQIFSTASGVGSV